ncbi:methyltransferase type 11 [Sulfurifustis variabilis]|uniref:Arsenite methyltransferase n=1 Tax=Sulfurifustis variabilis TaxID=1675686 RepID=A0A1B4VB88_9GAMM|nr:methyltransferase domain-containing protein [Sulfurifustis variabilis]BAU49394.1 methyltransferase type 11 [Sulfurifustis variabilis]
MALTAPPNFDSGYLRAQVRAEYERVAREPHGEFHFHRGPEYASNLLGYDAAELAALPEECTARFAGVGNPLRIGDAPGVAPVTRGETVLDHACGAGMDLLLAARRVGPTGRAIGVDMTPAMREQARAAAERAGLGEIVDIRDGMYEDLPVESESIDVVISNGVVNLAPDKTRVFAEIHRVLKPGGRLFLADVIVQRELTAEARNDPDIWAACIGGALMEGEMLELARTSGLVDGRIVQRFNCFMGTSAEQHVSKDLFVHAVNFYARKR